VRGRDFKNKNKFKDEVKKNLNRTIVMNIIIL
jgi:hypothetical protein